MSDSVLWVRTAKMNRIFSDSRIVRWELACKVESPTLWSSTVISKATAPSRPHRQTLPLLRGPLSGNGTPLLAWLLLLYSQGREGCA